MGVRGALRGPSCGGLAERYGDAGHGPRSSCLGEMHSPCHAGTGNPRSSLGLGARHITDSPSGFVNNRDPNPNQISQSVGPAETARMQLAAGDLPRPLVESGASLRAHFDEIASRPAITAGGFAADRAAAGPMEIEITGIGLAGRVNDEAMLVTVDPGEVPRVVIFEDAHGVLLKPRRGATTLTPASPARRLRG